MRGLTKPRALSVSCNRAVVTFSHCNVFVVRECFFFFCVRSAVRKRLLICASVSFLRAISIVKQSIKLNAKHNENFRYIYI